MRSLSGTCALFLLALCSLTVRADPQPEKIASGRSVYFAAELGTTPDILGMGFEKNLSTTDSNGDSHRVYAPKAVDVAVNQYDAKFEQIENSLLLDAHGHYLFVQAGVKASSTRRYMVVRAYQVTKVAKLLAEGRPLASAPMYASKIFYGWALYVVIEGDSTSFTADIAAELMTAGANLSKAIKTKHLTSHVHLIGLRPRKNGDIPIAMTLDDVKQGFETAPEPQPIFVEYSLLQDLVVDSIPWSMNKLTPGRYTVSVELAVMDTKANGKAWDVGSKPDPLAALVVDGQAITSCKQQDSIESHCLHDLVIDVTESTTLALHVTESDIAADDDVGDTVPIVIMQSGLVPGTPFELRTRRQLRSASLLLTPMH